MTMKQKPIFSKKEVVIDYPNLDTLTLGGIKEYRIATVKYVGAQQEYYKEGDKILYTFQERHKDRPSKINFFKDENLLRFENENEIICKLQEEE